ncbi:hypothetical protein LZD49_31215 [Dyadobacter sp. CY261]|uniref:hypothetical protein n=1 Tax=Dyadobacter sp. CY261 TaxID=2907203 RepID=UPI001F22406E|nr:hypothetical protein [Dyadobacter sp. CY261]MCF0074996.1 hypothetical protein [Dyadobacter sp. CY261]
MRSTLHYLLLTMLAAALGCQSRYPEMSPELLLGANDNVTSERRFGSCTILFRLTNYVAGIDQASQQAALQNVANIWGGAHGYLDVSDADGRVPAITVTFTDSAAFKKRPTDEGLFSQSLLALGALRRNNDGTCAILLRQSYSWTLPILQRVLLYHMGVALGLRDSSDGEAAMNPDYAYGILALTRSDSNAISAVYDQPCDEWARVNTQVLLTNSDLPRLRATFSNQNKGFLIIDMLSGTNKVMEFDPSSTTANWIVRKSFPGEVVKNNVQTIITFSIGERMYAGNLYTTKPGKFWEYVAAAGTMQDSWRAVADCPLMVSDAQSFGLEGKGYMVSSASRNGNWQVIAYDPALDKWIHDPAFDLPGSGTFTKLSNIPTFSVEPSAYLLTNNYYWRFMPGTSAGPWEKVPPLGINGILHTFSSRGSGFIYRPFSAQLWRFSNGREWTLCKPFTENLGSPYFSFAIARRVYMCWNTETLYKYNP